MPLTNSQLRYYDSTILRLPQEKRTEYHGQVDRLVAALTSNVRDRAEIKITKVVKAGSFAKHTILRKTALDPVDVDVVFYIAGRNESQETLTSLLEDIYALLIKLYPTKVIDDFEIQNRAATITFVGSGLSVDIVPVIEVAGYPGYGYQFGLDGSVNMTCAPCQIQFVKSRKDTDSDYRTLVRMAKRWRNQAEIKPLKSFTIELIMAYLLDTRGKGDLLEKRFCDFLLYLAQTGLKEQITFPENVEPFGVFSHPVVILDPVNSKNNVGARISETERLEIAASAAKSWEDAHFASAENDLELWKEVFGPRFKVED